MLTGLRLLRLTEQHAYSINTAEEPVQLNVEAESIALLWTLHARADLHLTKFFSFFITGTGGVPLMHPDLGSEANEGDEHMVVSGRRPLRPAWLLGGIALHL